MTTTDQPQKAILSPIKIGNMNLGHRVVLAPLTRLRSTIKNVPTDLNVEYYKQRASAGGLLLAECTGISPTSLSYPYGPGIFNKEQIEGWKRVTNAVHEKGGFIYLQLWHGGRTGKQSLNPNNEQVVSASAIAATGKDLIDDDYEMPRALEISEIKDIIKDFRQAALNSIEAGFDGIEIHAAFGYLLHSFIATGSNLRTDEYGGSIENRCRFTLEVVDAIIDAIGADRTGIRVSPGGGEFHSATEEFPVKTCSYLVSQLQKHHPDLAFVHFMQTRNASNINFDHAEVYRSHWKGPVISSGFSSSTVNHAVEQAEKTGDLIAFGRYFISNPDLPDRIRYGYPIVERCDPQTFYTQNETGYTDYPTYNKNNNTT